MINKKKVLENTKNVLIREGYKVLDSNMPDTILVVSILGYSDMFTLESFDEDGVSFKSSLNSCICKNFDTIVERHLGEILYTYGEIESKEETMEELEEKFKTKFSKGIIEFLSSEEANNLFKGESDNGSEVVIEGCNNINISPTEISFSKEGGSNVVNESSNNTFFLLGEANKVISQVRRELYMIVKLAGNTLTTDIEEYLMTNVEKLAKMESRIERVL